MAVDITALYCCLDDCCRVFEDWEAHRLIPSQAARQPLRWHSTRFRARNLRQLRPGKLSRAETKVG